MTKRKGRKPTDWKAKFEEAEERINALQEGIQYAQSERNAFKAELDITKTHLSSCEKDRIHYKDRYDFVMDRLLNVTDEVKSLEKELLACYRKIYNLDA